VVSQRDIVLVPVPFSDLSATKRRPVLVLSSTSHNRKSPDIIVVAITSNLASGGVSVGIHSDDLDIGSLPAASLVRADKVYTLSKSIILKRLGRVKVVVFQDVLTKLDQVLGRHRDNDA